jgi:hypothetical protein
MSNAYDEFDFEDDAETGKSEGGTLRKKLEAAIKVLKAKDAEIAELQKFRTEAEVGKFLKDIPPKFHRLAQKELAGNPTAEGYKAFVEEYGDLWGAELEEQDPMDAGIQEALEKINAATREARNIKDEPFKMPTPDQLQRMSTADVSKLMEQAQANWKR